MDGTTMKTRFAHSRGFSLTELMVSITIGLVILAAVSSLFVTSKRNYNEQDRQAKMQENARFAINFLMYDLRHAGYYGCMDDITRPTANAPGTVYTSLAAGSFVFSPYAAVEGLDNAAAGKKWYPSNVESLPTNIELGTDALIIRMAQPAQTLTLASQMPNTSVGITVANSTWLGNFRQGDIILIADCATADITQISAVAGTTLQHGTGGTMTPGNSVAQLSKAYRPPARVMKYASRIYYVRKNPAGIPSLYRQDNNGAAEELVEGVEQMHITYGKDTDDPGDDVPNIFLKAGENGLQSEADWRRVRAVRVGLLVRTPNDKDQDVDNRSYTVNGESIAAAGDHNRRRLFMFTVDLRNLKRDPL